MNVFGNSIGNSDLYNVVDVFRLYIASNRNETVFRPSQKRQKKKKRKLKKSTQFSNLTVILWKLEIFHFL